MLTWIHAMDMKHWDSSPQMPARIKRNALILHCEILPLIMPSIGLTVEPVDKNIVRRGRSGEMSIAESLTRGFVDTRTS